MKYKTGQTFSKKFYITLEKVKRFAEVTGDKNPLHLDEQYAKNSIFGERIAHGMLVSSCISNVLANDFPGPGTVYLSQSLDFKLPVFFGDIIEVKLKVIHVREDKKIMTLETICVNQNSKIVIQGKAVVKFN